MYSETVQKNKKTTTQFLKVMGLVFAVVLLTGVMQEADRVYNLVYLKYAVYVGLGVCCYLVIKKTLTDYRYSILESELMFEQLIGSNQRRLEIIDFSEVKSHGWLGNSEPVNATKATGAKNNRYVVEYQRDGTVYNVVFSPSEKYIETLTESLEKFRDQSSNVSNDERKNTPNDTAPK